MFGAAVGAANRVFLRVCTLGPESKSPRRMRSAPIDSHIKAVSHSMPLRINRRGRHREADRPIPPNHECAFNARITADTIDVLAQASSPNRNHTLPISSSIVATVRALLPALLKR